MMKVHQDESQNIEYKEAWNDKYLDWVCGFADASGAEYLWWCTSVGTANHVHEDDECWKGHHLWGH